MPTGTRIGHVHLNVGDLTAAEAFYAGVLGFDVIVRGYLARCSSPRAATTTI